MNIKEQYNKFASHYSNNLDVYDQIGNSTFYDALSDLDFKNKKVLDIGCGDGSDLSIIKQWGSQVYGVEPSHEFILSAKEKGISVAQGVGEELPFSDTKFDIVISKYALQTSVDVGKCLSEAARVLKSGGDLVILSKHPIRQFLEKGESKRDYFKQEPVRSKIYEGTIELVEPSHTFSDYFSKEFFENFELLDFIESYDFPASEQLNGDIYPTFFIVKARRK